MKDQLTALLLDALQALVPNTKAEQINLERPKSDDHGDFATNLALTLTKALKKPPRDIAEQIIGAIPDNDLISKVEIAGPGFINFFLNAATQQSVVKTIYAQGAAYGANSTGHDGSGKLQKVQIEFVSANPTGPLHVGHGRGAAVGDSLSRIMQANGWEVTREFYYNDAGAQIDNLTRSVLARAQGVLPDSEDFPQDGYRGEYIADIAQAYVNKETVKADDRVVTAKGDLADEEAVGEFAVAYLRHEQDLDLKAFQIQFDEFTLESGLYADGKVESAVQELIKNGKTYEKEGALWLKTTEYGDDKDRVMRKAEGGYTYFVPDVAYHLDKWQRGFVNVINEQGADHHSTITRVRAGLQALNAGIPEGWPNYVLHKMVRVMRGGEEVKISKRAGSYVTLRDLIDEVGCDATRYFLAARSVDSQLVFDIDLALSQSNENPVYYIQYAHARICSVLKQWGGEISGLYNVDLAALQEPHEVNLMQRLSAYPESVASAGREMAPHMVANYLKALASDLHSYYNEHKFIIDDEAMMLARLSLIGATQQVLQNGLSLLGVSAPESM